MIRINYKFFFLFLVTFLFSASIYSDSQKIIENLKIADGFIIEVFAENINTPRQIAESSAGNIFVGSRNGGTITSIDNDGNKRIIAKDLSNATGVTYHQGLSLIHI